MCVTVCAAGGSVPSMPCLPACPSTSAPLSVGSVSSLVVARCVGGPDSTTLCRWRHVGWSSTEQFLLFTECSDCDLTIESFVIFVDFERLIIYQPRCVYTVINNHRVDFPVDQCYPQMSTPIPQSLLHQSSTTWLGALSIFSAKYTPIL